MQISLPRRAELPETTLEWKIPQWSNTLERDRARSLRRLTAAMAVTVVEEVYGAAEAGRPQHVHPFEAPNEAFSCSFHEAPSADDCPATW